MVGFFADFVFAEENPRALIFCEYTDLTQFHVEFPVMFYDGTIILFHAFTRMGTAVSWVKGDSGQKTQEARSLVRHHKQAVEISALANHVSLGRDHSPVPV